VRIAPRFDYGAVAPWIRGQGGVFAAIGGDDGLLIRTDFDLDYDGRHELCGRIELGEDERARLELGFHLPVALDSLDEVDRLDGDALDQELEAAIEWWRDWAACIDNEVTDEFPVTLRSALTLRALTFDQTGAIAAAATTSLPEARRLSGERNWDYRYSWVRDSALAVRSLAELGCERDADAFRRFIERSAAGSARDLQILFGVGGERRLGEEELESMEGWRGAAPVRVGNQASGQLQLDAFGQLVDQSWRWHRRGNSPDHDYWVFVADLVDAAIEHWPQPDCGIWEWRGDPRHFVHSKALTWSAVDRGIRLGEDCGKDVPQRWREAREEIRAGVERHGYDEERGIFRMDYDHEDVDAALLRLPAVGFLDWHDERMARTADAIREELGFHGLLRRYSADDEMPEEGAFLACSFWLATCLARQGRRGEAREAYERACSTANDLGLFAEEFDPEAGRMLGNFPQALTHLSQIEAAIALRGGEDGD
jgi:GH15 family glucan-1,4-alpha-glucosidase